MVPSINSQQFRQPNIFYLMNLCSAYLEVIEDNAFVIDGEQVALYIYR